MSTRSNRHRRCATLAGVVALVALWLAAVPSAAQQQLGAVQGTITDQTGLVMPGVTVTVTNVDTGVARSTTSNESGVYRVPSLDPGRYEVAAELSGFKKVVQTVTVSVGATLGVNFTMQAGEIAETIEVTGVAPDISTEKADVSAVVETKKIEDLPLVGRNPLALATLQPGVVGIPGGTDFLSAEQGIGINANGQRGSGNSATVDGISINGNPWGGTVLLVPNVEAVQEFQVITNNPSAEYGRNAGAAVSIITKGGTNEFRGSAFEFFRDESLRARGVFERGTKAPFERDDFGVSFGGPIKRDSTFFFFSYEGVRQTSGSAAIYTVETQQLRDWVFANRPNSIAASLWREYPLPLYPTEGLRDLGSPARGGNITGPADGIPDVGTISYALINNRVGDQYNARVDQTFRGGSDRLRATYYLSEIETQYLYLREAFNHPYPTRNQLFSAGHTSVLSNTMLNEASFGYVRMHNTTGDPTPQTPTISITGLSGSAGFGVEFWHPITFTQNNFEFRDVLTMNRGEHSLRVGGEFRYGTDDSVLHHWERPVYNFVSVLDFVDDEPFREERAVDPATGATTVAVGEYRTKEWGLFIQDNWKLRSNLTLNLGLRYENFGNPTKLNGPFNGIVLGQGATRQEQMVTSRVAEIDKLWSTDWNNFAPRVGVAWDPKGDASLVIRGGGGIAYNRINNTNFSDERLNPPQFAHADTTIQNPSIPIVYSLGPNYTPNPALGRGVDENGGIKGARVSLRVVDPEVIIPYSYSWFAGFQKQLPWDFVLDVNYVGSAARNLMSGDGPGGEDYSRFAGDLLDGVRDRLNPSFADVGLAESRIDASYHGLTTQAIRRFRDGLAFQVAYTLGKAEDMAGFSEEVTQPEREKGPAGHDVRHVFKMNVVWEIPYKPTNQLLRYTLGGWQLNTITVYQSGSVFNVTCGLPYPQCDFNADGYTGERVNTPSFGTDLGSPSNDEWMAGVMTASDFPLPARGTLGTLPRNAFRGPSYFSTDLSLLKNIPVPWFGARDANVQLRLEAFNVFNQINLNNPVSAVNNTSFGRVTSARDMRIVQLGAKFVF